MQYLLHTIPLVLLTLLFILIGIYIIYSVFKKKPGFVPKSGSIEAAYFGKGKGYKIYVIISLGCVMLGLLAITIALLFDGL